MLVIPALFCSRILLINKHACHFGAVLFQDSVDQ